MLPFIHFGIFSFPTYGLMMAVTITCGVWLAVRRAPRHGMDPDFVYFASALAGLTALLMARVFDWALHPLAYWRSPERLIEGAGTFLIGFLGAIFVTFVLCRRKRLPMGKLTDCFAPALALGVALVRIGCFGAGCDYGRPTDLPWGVVFSDPLAAQLTGVPLGIRLHPSQLYESFLGLVTLALVLILDRRSRRPGLVFYTFGCCYAVGRFFLEYLRGDVDRGFWGPFSTSQWLSLIAVLALSVLYWLPSADDSSLTADLVDGQ